MVKLASAREIRLYGPHPTRNRWEYINSALHVFASALLTAGFSAQLSGRGDNEAGFAVILAALALLVLVNAHDLFAHAAGVDFRLGLVAYDLQLGLVELAVPLLHAIGAAVSFTAIIFLLIKEERGYDHKMGKHAVNMLIAGPLLWLIGSVLNTCQTYERANGDTQILQSAVQVPFLMGSCLFFVAGIFNRQASYSLRDHERLILMRSWSWLCTFGSLLILVGGLVNVAKVFRMQQRDGLRLEKLRGGAQERLFRDREGRFPILAEEGRRRQQQQPPQREELMRRTTA